MKSTDKQALKEFEEYLRNLIADVPVESDESPAAKIKRIRRLESDPIAWFKYYFPHYAKSEFAPFHIRAIKRLAANKRWYEVRAWSRELAKSAISMMEAIRFAALGEIRNFLLISNSEDNAKRLILPIRLEFENNKRLINDYGEQKLPGQWEEGEFKIRKGCAFRAVGAGQSPRGTRNESYRPDFILIDDIDTDEECRNPERIKTKWKWIEEALIPTMSVSGKTRIVFNGNIIAKDCCISRAIKKADHVDIINIRNKHGVSSWVKNSEEDIDYILSKISFSAAQKEYFNNPISEGDTFKELKWGRTPPLRSFPFLVAYADPATSNKDKKSSCTKAIVLLGYLNGYYYVIKCFVDHATTDTFIQWFFDLRNYVGDTITYYVIENNSLQNSFYEQVFLPKFSEKGKTQGDIGVTPDARNKGDKYTRIEGTLEPLVRTGGLIFNEAEKSDPNMQRLSDQFLCVSPSLSAPCDGVDATEGGVVFCRSKLNTTQSKIAVTPYINKNKRFF